jgi:molybdate transport system ATP-binding protein
MKLSFSKIKLTLGKLSFNYDLELESSISGIYGPSGGGKSTFLNLLSGINTPADGTIVIDDRTLFDKDNNINTPPEKRAIGVVFQENYLFPHMSVKQNLLYSKPYHKSNRQTITLEAVVELLDIHPLLAKKPGQLSGGERQRVAIGRALLSQPSLLLFDEPFSNLDRNRRKEIISYLLKINNRFRLPMLIVSHDLEDILRLTNYLVVINNKRIITSGSYVSIVERGNADGIVSHKRYLNVFDTFYVGHDKTHKLLKFGKKSQQCLLTNAPFYSKELHDNQRVRLCIHPDDIALSGSHIEGTSFQNQLSGRVVKLVEIKKSVFVTIDCGFILVAEISVPAYEKLSLEYNKEVFCLIKAKAIEVVHVFTDIKQ